MINFSTGRIIKKVYFEKELTAMDNDHTGQLIFCGDGQVYFLINLTCNKLKYMQNVQFSSLNEKLQGSIYTVRVNSHTGSISRSHKNRSMRSKSPITTVQYRTFSLVARCPVLLACAQDGNLCFFRLLISVHIE